MTTGAALLARIDGGLDASDLAPALGELDGAPRRAAPRTRYNLACHVATEDPARSLGILGDDSKRVAHPWALDDPVLQDLRTGDNGAAFRAALRRGGMDHGAWPLSRLDAVGVDGAEVLARAGIHSTAALVRAAGPKDARARLATKTGREKSQLHEWALLAELADVVFDPPAATLPGARAFEAEQGHALDIANLLAIAGITDAAMLVKATAADPDRSDPGKVPGPDDGRIGRLAVRLSGINAMETVVRFRQGESGSYEVPGELVERWRSTAAVSSSRVEAEEAEKGEKAGPAATEAKDAGAADVENSSDC